MAKKLEDSVILGGEGRRIVEETKNPKTLIQRMTKNPKTQKITKGKHNQNNKHFVNNKNGLEK